MKKNKLNSVPSKIKKHKITAIVPAYNEEKKILNVLKVLTRSKYLDEIICVNDGSCDSTLDVMKKVKGIKIINLRKNHGKAYAISRGILKAKGDIVLFVDADINGFCDKYIKLLTEPLIKGVSDAVIGFRSGKFESLFFRPFSGERVYFKEDLLPHLKTIQDKGYGLELYLNFIYKDKKINKIDLCGVENTFKHLKQSFWFSTKLTILEIFDLFTEVFRQKNPIYYYFSSCIPFYEKKYKPLNLLMERYKYMEVFYENVNFGFVTPFSFRRILPSFSKSVAMYSSLALIFTIFSLTITAASLDFKYKGFDSTKISSTLGSYKNYEKIIVANVVEPVRKKYLESILGNPEPVNNYTTGFLSA